MTYQQEYKASIEQPEAFWKKQSQRIQWFKEPGKILAKDENGIDRWFVDGEMNTAYLALDYHVLNGRGDQPALIYDSPVTGNKRTYTYAQLTESVALAAGMLKAQGVEGIRKRGLHIAMKRGLANYYYQLISIGKFGSWLQSHQEPS